MKKEIYAYDFIYETLQSLRYCGPSDELFDIWRMECELCLMYAGINDMKKASRMLDTVVRSAKRSIKDWKEVCVYTGEDPNKPNPKSYRWNYGR